jgi:hypothetical protein
MGNLKLSVLVLCSALLCLSACSKFDPDKPIQSSDVRNVKELLDKTQLARVSEMGGDNYFIGKTANYVKNNLDRDYEDFKADQFLAKKAKERDENLRLAREKKLTIENVVAPGATTDNEKKVYVNEARHYVEWLDRIAKLSNFSDIHGRIAPNKGAPLCRDITTLLKYEEADDAGKKQLIAKKQCRLIKKSIVQMPREQTSYQGREFVRVRGGWLAMETVENKSTPEELEKIREGRRETVRKMMDNPPIFVYTKLRPLLEVSPHDRVHQQQAESAIAAVMSQQKKSWEDAGRILVILQQQMKAEEIKCLRDKECKGLASANRELAKLLLASAAAPADKGELPCEILSIVECKPALEGTAAAMAQEKEE